jgi:hypothetical protein
MSACLNITCRNFDPHNHGEDCDDYCQACNTPISQNRWWEDGLDIVPEEEKNG